MPYKSTMPTDQTKRKLDLFRVESRGNGPLCPCQALAIGSWPCRSSQRKAEEVDLPQPASLAGFWEVGLDKTGAANNWCLFPPSRSTSRMTGEVSFAARKSSQDPHNRLRTSFRRAEVNLGCVALTSGAQVVQRAAWLQTSSP
jgi:hypothetical protein